MRMHKQFMPIIRAQCSRRVEVAANSFYGTYNIIYNTTMCLGAPGCTGVMHLSIYFIYCPTIPLWSEWGFTRGIDTKVLPHYGHLTKTKQTKVLYYVVRFVHVVTGAYVGDFTYSVCPTIGYLTSGYTKTAKTASAYYVTQKPGLHMI